MPRPAAWDARTRAIPQELDERPVREQLAGALACERHNDGCNQAASLGYLSRCRAFLLHLRNTNSLLLLSYGPIMSHLCIYQDFVVSLQTCKDAITGAASKQELTRWEHFCTVFKNKIKSAEAAVTWPGCR